jgi:hypothetical protein
MSPFRANPRGEPLIVDHLKAIKVDAYRARVVRRLRQIAEGRAVPYDMTVIHEHDDRCCRREPWRVTMSGLLAETETRTLYIRFGGPGAPS